MCVGNDQSLVAYRGQPQNSLECALTWLHNPRMSWGTWHHLDATHTHTGCSEDVCYTGPHRSPLWVPLRAGSLTWFRSSYGACLNCSGLVTSGACGGTWPGPRSPCGLLYPHLSETRKSARGVQPGHSAEMRPLCALPMSASRGQRCHTNASLCPGGWNSARAQEAPEPRKPIVGLPASQPPPLRAPEF